MNFILDAKFSTRSGCSRYFGSAWLVVVLLAGCASAPDKSVSVNAPRSALASATAGPTTTSATIAHLIAPLPTCEICASCAACAGSTTVPMLPDNTALMPADTAPMLPEASRGRLERATWQALPNWGVDDPGPALNAFLQGCFAMKAQPVWSDVCAKAASLQNRTGAASSTITRFFETEFEPYQAINADNSATGVVTGYYEPLLRGSRIRTEIFRYPIYAPPQDLISIDLAEVYPELKNRRLRGRLIGNKLVPYFDRGLIEADASPLKGLEIAWVDDPVESFFLQIQGSGQIQLPDGTRMRIGYADQNGYPFKSLAGALIRRGEIRAERASMQGIKAWAQKNPGKVRQFMNINPSYVFFKELPPDLSGPIGTLGVPLTAERSIAVDQRVIPLGVPVYLATTLPLSKEPLNRLMVAQDTGGAIFGAVRADYFFGFGDAAGNQAGRMKQQGRMWVLLPRGYDPNALTLPSIPVSAATSISAPASTAP